MVVFTARRADQDVVPIDIPRPRDPLHRKLKLRRQLADLMRDEVGRAFAEQEALATAS